MIRRIETGFKFVVLLFLLIGAVAQYAGQPTYDVLIGDEVTNRISNSVRIIDDSPVLFSVVWHEELATTALELMSLDDYGNTTFSDSTIFPCCNNLFTGFSGSFENTNDGGLIWAGTSTGLVGLIARYDSALDTVWTKVYTQVGGYDVDAFDQIEPLDNGHFIIAGRTTVESTPKVLVLEVDQLGNIVWVGDEFDDSQFFEGPFDLSVSENGLIYVSGMRYFSDTNLPFVSCYSQAGEIEWSTELGNMEFYNSHMKVVAAPDNGVLTAYIHTDSLIGEINEFSAIGEVRFTKFSSSGVIEDEFETGSTKLFGAVHDLDLQDDGTILCVGEEWTGNAGHIVSWFQKVSPQYELLFERTYDHLECSFCRNLLTDVTATENSYYLSGYAHLDTLQYDFLFQSWVVKTDCEGRLDPPPLDLDIEVTVIDDSTISIVPIDSVFHEYHWDLDNGDEVWADTLVYTYDTSGEYTIELSAFYCDYQIDTSVVFSATVGIEEHLIESFILAPNPTNGSTMLVVPQKTDSKIVVTDLRGNVVHEALLSSTQYTIPSNRWAQGVYLVRLGDFVQRLVVE